MGSSLLLPTGQPGPMQDGEYVPIAPPNLVTIKLRDVNPPSLTYLQRDDVIGALGISALAGEVITISGRLLRASDGVIVPFAFSITPSAAYTVASATQSLAEGYLLGVIVSCTQANRRGQTWCTLFLARGAVTTTPLVGLEQILCSDYLTGNVPTGWPGGRIIPANDFPGSRVSITPSNPAVGTDLSVSGNKQTISRILSLKCTLTASATVANRLVEFNISAGAQRVGAQVAVTAGQAVVFSLGWGVGNYTDASGTVVIGLPQAGVNIATGGTPTIVTSVTTGIQAGDQWSAITCVIDETLNVA